MEYISTRQKGPELGFDDVLLTGLSQDGGLYVPKSWPTFSANDITNMKGLNYRELAIEIMLPFLGGSTTKTVFREIVDKSYSDFKHPDIAPIKNIGHNQWIVELFHGPTLAFKDYPLQIVGRLFDHVLKKRKKTVTIIGATSGDTGSAAIDACRGRETMKIFILHPHGRVSEVQRRQMTTVKSENVFNIALDGTFDDCQDMVKSLFADNKLRESHNFSAVNSINWARIMAQIVYYFWTAISLGAPAKKFCFAVPTGNFGNVYAGYVAKQMGLPIEKLIIGSNSNDILTRFFSPQNIEGKMSMAPVICTSSPSMDIQISSNFERVLFDYCGRDGILVSKLLEDFRENNAINFGAEVWRSMCKVFEGYSFSDEEVYSAISEFHRKTGEILDPHSMIGVAAGIKGHIEPGNILVNLATAHPAKFPEAVRKSTGITPELPSHLSDLFDRKERFVCLPNNFDAVRNFIDRSQKK